MDSTLPLYRQLTSRLLLLFLSFMVLFSVGFYFYLQYEQDLTQLKHQQLPAIEEFNQHQQLLIKSDRILSGILNSKYANTLANDYLILQENIKSISDVNRKNRRLLEQLIMRLKAQSVNVSLLTENERRNIQLKDNVIIQLTLIADNLANLISEQSDEQETLNRQINEEKSSNRIMVNRVKAYSRLLTKIKINHELHQSLIDTLVMFNQLDLQYDLADFDYTTLKAQRNINDWLDNAAIAVSRSSNENALMEQVLVLNALLFNEQNTLAKWRGQLRMAIDLQTELRKQKIELAPLLNKILVVQPIKSPIIEQKILSWLALVDVSFQPKYYIWLITATFLIIGITFIILLISLRKKIKHAGLQGIAVIDELVTTGEVSTSVPVQEINTIISKVEQLSKPLHSESDFQLQQQQFKAHNALMSRHTGNIYWQLPLASKKLLRKLTALLAVEASDKHWRHFFSRADVRLILSSARKAKNNQRVEKINLTSNQEKAVAITIEYIDSTWCGSIQNIEEYRLLKDENVQLHQQVKQQNQINKLAVIASSEDVLDITSNIMAQQQLSLTPGDQGYVYQQLQQLTQLSEQQRTCAQLRCDDFILSLSTVSLVNEVNTAIANVSFYQAQNNNHIFVNLDENLAHLVTLESELFQAMLTTICQKMFTEQSMSMLDIDLKVIDVNSAQQIVRISFTIKKASQLQPLQETINTLAFNEEANESLNNITDNYLKDLQLIFNVNNKVCQSLDEGGKFSFDMPFAIAEDLHQKSNDKIIKLSKRSLLVIATEKANRERICQALSKSKAVIETMQDMVLFQRQISLKHLTRNPIDVIILSAEVYLTDYDLITQHMASLPNKLQPKILVLQPYHCEILQRTGLFSSCNLPWFSETLIAEVQQLLRSDSKINLVVEPEIFAPYRFLPSKVEVLVGIAETKSKQLLIRTLHWLGLKVTLVSRPEQLERLWQSGRFLLVISEFSDFNMVVNKDVSAQRGIFILNQHLAKKTDVIHNNVSHTVNGTYEIKYLAPVLDIQKLTEQLSPWLISGLGVNASSEQQTPVTSGKDINAAKMNTSAKAMPLAPATNKADIEQLLSIELDNKLEQVSEITSNAFDLNQYAQNQGSAELAAFMLDDYLTEITDYSQEFVTAIDQQNIDLAKQKLVLLVKLAKVIAAKPLITQCDELSKTLNNDGGQADVLAKLDNEIQQKIHHLKQCIVELTEFAETI
ncbi:MAG: hypothetical protein ACI92O_003446 [Colwellia sp.]|jgi:hypothetical protein